uniref:COPI coat complex subunit gamma 1 n=1 Tax=Marmota marmota marmota TaxID=9994 RepID=A0A8C6A9K2_MARMA
MCEALGSILSTTYKYKKNFKINKRAEDVPRGGSNPFQHLEKSAVLQEARVFNETPINPRKCAHILTKILYLINQGEHLGTTEATEAFFAMTKLFQSNDPTLRRMCYLTIKEMSCIAEDVIIVTSPKQLIHSVLGAEPRGALPLNCTPSPFYLFSF